MSHFARCACESWSRAVSQHFALAAPVRDGGSKDIEKVAALWCDICKSVNGLCIVLKKILESHERKCCCPSALVCCLILEGCITLAYHQRTRKKIPDRRGLYAKKLFFLSRSFQNVSIHHFRRILGGPQILTSRTRRSPRDHHRSHF